MNVCVGTSGFLKIKIHLKQYLLKIISTTVDKKNSK